MTFPAPLPPPPPSPPPAVASPRFRVALQGFSGFERSALASYFRLAGDRFPAYEQAEGLNDARFIVADADHPDAVRQVVEAGRLADTVFIGAQVPEGALAWMMRPIDPMHVLRELDAAVALRQHGGTPSANAAEFPSRRASDRPAPARNVSPQVLVVDDNELAARALERDLQALGLSVARANTSGKALELLSRLAFRFVFTDLDLGTASELDGLGLCQQIKHEHPHGSGPVPAVFLLTEPGRPVSRVRGTLAGCDACLDKPVDEGQLKRLLAAHGARLDRQGPVRLLQR